MKKLAVFAFLSIGVAVAAGLSGLPDEISRFVDWTIVADKLPEGGAHSGQKTVFANRIAVNEWKTGKTMPVGATVIKAGGDITKPDYAAVMTKTSKGWEFSEYTANAGKYTMTVNPQTGQRSCGGCHNGAKDSLFTRK